MAIRRGWTRQLAATALLVAACGAAGTVIACGDSTGTGADGTYTLNAVNGHMLPATVSWGVSEQTIGSGSLTLRSAGTFTLTAATQGGQALVNREGSWKSSGTRVVLLYALTPGPAVCIEPIVQDTATRSGTTLSFPSHVLPPCNGGATLTFKR